MPPLFSVLSVDLISGRKSQALYLQIQLMSLFKASLLAEGCLRGNSSVTSCLQCKVHLCEDMSVVGNIIGV